MKIYKITLLINLVVSSLFLIISWVLHDSTNHIALWISNISGGIFASAILLVGTSIIGYLIEEQKQCLQYYWKLIALRSKVIILSTLPVGKSSHEDYYNAISQVNELLIGFFAMFEQDFVFYKRRRKIQKLLEIHTMLFECEKLSVNAEICFRQYLAQTKTGEGKRQYEFEEFKADINGFIAFIDKYEDTGEPFVVYLDKKIQEYHELL